MVYKALYKNNYDCFENRKYQLPKDGKPGEWEPYINPKIRIKSTAYDCSETVEGWSTNGYFICRDISELVRASSAAIFWVIKLAPEATIIEHNGCSITSGPLRFITPITEWDERTRNLFHCDCVERFNAIYREQIPEDVAFPALVAEIIQAVRSKTATREQLQEFYWFRTSVWNKVWARDKPLSTKQMAEQNWQVERLKHYLPGYE